MGTIDNERKYKLVAVSIISLENSEVYGQVFSTLKDALKNKFNTEYNVDYVVSDNDDEILKAAANYFKHFNHIFANST